MVTDAELVKRVLLINDRQAYCDLVRKYQVEVRLYLARLTQNREVADDLAQEVFLSGYRKLNQLKDPDRYRAWVYSIAHTEFFSGAAREKSSSPKLSSKSPSRTPHWPMLKCEIYSGSCDPRSDRP